MTNNERLVTILARKFATPHWREEDLYQEGMLALMRARQTFRPGASVKFETYASRVISNRFIDLLRKKTENTHELNEDTQRGDFNLDDEVNLIEIRKILHEQVGDLDRAIFNSYIEGFSYDEMGTIFELSKKKIDNIVQKVRRKIKENI